jgi:hypothetical protein
MNRHCISYSCFRKHLHRNTLAATSSFFYTLTFTFTFLAGNAFTRHVYLARRQQSKNKPISAFFWIYFETVVFLASWQHCLYPCSVAVNMFAVFLCTVMYRLCSDPTFHTSLPVVVCVGGGGGGMAALTCCFVGIKGTRLTAGQEPITIELWLICTQAFRMWESNYWSSNFCLP